MEPIFLELYSEYKKSKIGVTYRIREQSPSPETPLFASSNKTTSSKRVAVYVGDPPYIHFAA